MAESIDERIYFIRSKRWVAYPKAIEILAHLNALLKHPRTTRMPSLAVYGDSEDELLSSWLARHAAYYGVTGQFFAKWLMLGTRNLSVPTIGWDWRRSRAYPKLRRDPIALIAMTFIDAPAGSAELICRNRAPQICRPCADRHAREGASGAVPKHWRKAWRVTCPACGAPLSDTNERPDTAKHCATPALSGAYGRKL